ncbi:MAG: hypothetical protein KAI98_09245 [Gemmatimonadetes bacterium]|nr:hypothetical protein [Gemmatimonadota bacterium]
MKSFGACSAIVMAPGCLQFLLVGVLSVGPAVGASPLGAQSVQPAPSGAWAVEFSESPGGESPTFRSDPQPVTVREAMGAVLVTAEPFRLLTDLTESRLAGCQPTRPDLPDARIQPEEIADRIGSLTLAVFEEGEVSFTFRTTTNGAECAITMDGTKSGTVQVSRAQSGELVLSATGSPLSVIRDRAEMFTCAGATNFTIRLAP